MRHLPACTAGVIARQATVRAAPPVVRHAATDAPHV